jgi:hypothetical protein
MLQKSGNRFRLARRSVSAAIMRGQSDEFMIRNTLQR